MFLLGYGLVFRRVFPSGQNFPISALLLSMAQDSMLVSLQPTSVLLVRIMFGGLEMEKSGLSSLDNVALNIFR